MQEKLFSKTFTLLPGEGNGQQEMPLMLLVNRIIEVASLHAEVWGVGYTTLIQQHTAWVLSRLTIEMKRYPRIGEEYTLQTWIESYNTRFSERNFVILGASGEVYGYARTVWLVLNLDTRRSAELSILQKLGERVLDKECPIAPLSRFKVTATEKFSSYPVRYSDIDLNRHVNSMRYVEHLLDLYPFSWYDTHCVNRFEIAYMHEARPGIEVDVYAQKTAPLDHCVELRHDDTPLCRARLIFSFRDTAN